MMFRLGCLVTTLALLLAIDSFAQESGHQRDHSGHQMVVDTDGVVMNENIATLPRDCEAISRDYDLTIQAGKEYAADTAGAVFGMSQHEVRVEPCSRISVTFVNEDSVRHQWMVHGLPKYLYPAGMFHIETAGGKSKTGTFIVPGDDQTFLIHCDMAQHMEMGMRGQLVVGAGSGNLWGVDGISDQFFRSSYLPTWAMTSLLFVLFISFLISLRLLKRP
jgi:plastocyanin